MNGRRARRCLAGFGLGLLLALAPAMLVAETPDELLARAVAAKERALEADSRELWVEALQAFQHADAARPSAGAAYEVAFAAERLQHDDLALEMYEESLARGLTGRARVRAEAFVANRTASTGRVELRGAAGTAVYLRGAWRATLPAPRALVIASGEQTLEVVGPRGERSRRTLQLQPGQRLVVDLTPAALPPTTASAQPAAPGAPRAATPPSAASERAAVRPAALAGQQSDPGAQEAPGSPRVDRGPARPAGVVLVAGGSLLVAGASVLIPVASSRLEYHRGRLELFCAEIEDRDDCRALWDESGRDAAQDHVDQIATWKAVRTGSFVAGGAGLIALGSGIALLVAERRRAPARATRAAVPLVVAGPDGAVLGLRGAF